MCAVEGDGKSLVIKMKKAFFIILGTIAMVIGFIGLFLPVIPTTPLVILAAACYYRSSDRLHNWILRSKWFGDTVENYQAGKGLTKNNKIKAIVLMWAMITISVVFFVENFLIQLILLGIAITVSLYIIKLPTYID
ncbi:MAG: YbaN family protein [Candidatus Bathyarchaeota archaeon]|jgi:hypothetical protein